MESRSEAPRRIEEIYTRVTGQEVFRNLIGTLDPKVKEVKRQIEDAAGGEMGEVSAREATRFIYNETRIPTKVAVSEIPASDELKSTISKKAKNAAKWVWENGKDPEECKEELKKRDLDYSDLGKIVLDDQFYVAVEENGKDRYPGEAVSPVLLYIAQEDQQKGTFIQSSLGYNNTFELEIFYYRDPRRPDLRSANYDSAVRPLDDIAENEGIILDGLLDEFIDKYHIGENQGS